jgi:nucleotide-binding universal stress UspA family protein
MKRILVATDFSACAANAMDYAMELAQVLKVEVIVLHAIGTFEGIFNNTYNALYIEEYYNSKREALKNWAQTFSARPEFQDIPLLTICEVGTVSAVITKFIDSNPVELLIMGTMGSTGITGLFGSNASTMVEKTKTPTLIIPLESKFSTNPVITLATDFSTTLSGSDVNALNEVLKGFGSQKLNVLNVMSSVPDFQANKAGEEAVRQMVAVSNVEFQYIKEDSPTEGIVNYIVSSQTDIICVVKRHHNLIYRLFNTSTVNRLLHRSLKAVLVLHE